MADIKRETIVCEENGAGNLWANSWYAIRTYETKIGRLRRAGTVFIGDIRYSSESDARKAARDWLENQNNDAPAEYLGPIEVSE